MKLSIKKSLLFCSAVLFSQSLLGSMSTTSVGVSGTQLSEKKFTLPQGRGELTVTVRETQAHFGLPYTVEAKANCVADAKSTKGNIMNAVCDVKAGSVKLSADGRSVILKVRQTDSEAFNLKTQTASPEELMKLEPGCMAEGTDMVISLESFCR